MNTNELFINFVRNTLTIYELIMKYAFIWPYLFDIDFYDSLFTKYKCVYVLSRASARIICFLARCFNFCGGLPCIRKDKFKQSQLMITALFALFSCFSIQITPSKIAWRDYYNLQIFFAYFKDGCLLLSVLSSGQTVN